MRERCSEICPGDELKTKQDTKRTKRTLTCFIAATCRSLIVREKPREDMPRLGVRTNQIVPFVDERWLKTTGSCGWRSLPSSPLSLPLRPPFVAGHAVQGWTGDRHI